LPGTAGQLAHKTPTCGPSAAFGADPASWNAISAQRVTAQAWPPAPPPQERPSAGGVGGGVSHQRTRVRTKRASCWKG